MRPATLLKETLAQIFFCEFCEISKNTFFTGHLWTTASEKYVKLFWVQGLFQKKKATTIFKARLSLKEEDEYLSTRHRREYAVVGLQE